MKRTSNAYRLNLIKQAALRNQSSGCDDPMAKFIFERLAHQPSVDNQVEHHQHFSGSHYDEHIGGWVSDMWGQK
jgi:hypothetical protein